MKAVVSSYEGAPVLSLTLLRPRGPSVMCSMTTKEMSRQLNVRVQTRELYPSRTVSRSARPGRLHAAWPLWTTVTDHRITCVSSLEIVYDG
jgi:hypothetical protein